MKVLVIGPSVARSKGGMATVIDEIAKDRDLKDSFDIDVYESYIDGNKLKVLFYSIFSFIRFYFTKRDYDLYHIHAASYGSTFRKGWYVRAAKKWGKKVILHIHGAEYMIFFEKSKKKKEIVSILKSADKVIALSAQWKRRFDEIFGLQNCVVLENGIDTERLKPAITDNREHPHTLVSLGRLGKRKGTYDLIDAISEVKKQIPDIICYLAGDGNVRECIEIVNKKGLANNVFFTGWVECEEKIKLLQKSSVLVLPSYNEGLPMAILEGMACGKAIISTTVGAIPEVIKEDNGILISPGDISALTSAILLYCKNDSIVRRMGHNNIELINKKYSMQVMHKKLEKIYISTMET